MGKGRFDKERGWGPRKIYFEKKVLKKKRIKMSIRLGNYETEKTTKQTIIS